MGRMTSQQVEYARRAITRHIQFHLHEDAVASFTATNIAWAQWQDVFSQDWPEDTTVVIPIVPRELIDPVTWSVPFRGTQLTLWNRVPLPEEWVCDNAEAPLWYRGPKGQFMPAWDLVGTVFDLLTMQEERTLQRRDPMDRALAKMSPRQTDGRLLVPIVNNSAAALVDLCVRQQHADNAASIALAKPISVCLSHDLDQLRGDDFWTQAARLWRFVAPLRHFRLPRFSALGIMFSNFLRPRRYFIDDLLAMLAAERLRAFRSINYVLCGVKGRYGARTSSRCIRQYLKEVEPYGDIGMHYNYGTLGQVDAFDRQRNEIETLASNLPVAGRAHYLVMDPKDSFQFWEARGIKLDESLGYPDAVGYRAGIAGPFKPFNPATHDESSIISLPLVAMDSAVASQFGGEYELAIETLVRHLSVVGGTFTLLFHPGMFANPEHPETLGMYERILDIFVRYNAVSKTPLAILAEIDCDEGRMC